MSDRNFSAVVSKMQAAPGSDHHQTLLTVIHAIGAGDFESLHLHITDDVELHIHGFLPMDGSWKGRQDVVAATAANFSLVTEQTPQIEGMVQQGDVMALLLHETGRLKANGRKYEVRGVIWYTFEGSRLKRIEEFVHAIGV